MSSVCSFSFTLSNHTRYGPRIGNLVLKRQAAEPIQIQTPGIITATSRGVVPHLSRDNHRLTDAIRWVNVPFETFLEHTPPVPTLQPGSNPLHTFLGFVPGKHVLSMSARDPADSREMPPNGKDQISVQTLRGVRRLSPSDWRSYVLACQPDLVFALSDTPFTDPPYSQKRLTKSIVRSAEWLATMISQSAAHSLNILVHLAGGTCIPARRAFSDSLLEKAFGPEAEAIKPFESLDEGLSGYTVDLVPLRQSFDAIEIKAAPPDIPTTIEQGILSHVDSITPLLEASLASLPSEKLRVVNSTQTPQEILHYISSIGIDIFDAFWVQDAASIGVALDFEFPVRNNADTASKAKPEKREIGHNLYEIQYRRDYGQVSDAFRGAVQPIGPRLPETDVEGQTRPAVEWEESKPICPCATCSPKSASIHINHGADTPDFSYPDPSYPPAALGEPQPPFSRAYIHHLLHTHEMSAHTLLAMHNLTILDLFFSGIREVLANRPHQWEQEVTRFCDLYDENVWVQGGLFERAKRGWKDVDLARGKGRLAREKERDQGSSNELSDGNA